jgi:hypothetical protein
MTAIKRKHILGDLIFFITAVAFPSSFFNFVDRSVLFDIRFIYMIIGLLYLILNIENLNNVYRLKGGRLLLIVCSFLVIQLIYSIIVQAIDVFEVITIFRTNFFYPIATLGFLLYASKMDNRRLYRFTKWLMSITYVIGVLYILSNISGVNIYANQPKDLQEFEGITIIQNLWALPDYNVFLYVFALIAAIYVSGFKKHWLWLVPLVVVLISIVRNLIVVYTMILILLFAFGLFSRLRISTNKTIGAVFFVFVAIMFVMIFFPSHTELTLQKFRFTEGSNEMRYLTEEGTYALRLKLVDDSYQRTKMNNNLILGNGYIREASRGEYDFVVGGDTEIAPVLWAEGFVGLIIRLLPVLYFLYLGIKHFRSRDVLTAYISLIMISLILPELINIVQTKIFTFYHHHIFIIFLMMMFVNNRRIKRDNFKIPYINA